MLSFSAAAARDSRVEKREEAAEHRCKGSRDVKGGELQKGGRRCEERGDGRCSLDALQDSLSLHPFVVAGASPIAARQECRRRNREGEAKDDARKREREAAKGVQAKDSRRGEWLNRKERQQPRRGFTGSLGLLTAACKQQQQVRCAWQARHARMLGGREREQRVQVVTSCEEETRWQRGTRTQQHSHLSNDGGSRAR